MQDFGGSLPDVHICTYTYSSASQSTLIKRIVGTLLEVGQEFVKFTALIYLVYFLFFPFPFKKRFHNVKKGADLTFHSTSFRREPMSFAGGETRTDPISHVFPSAVGRR